MSFAARIGDQLAHGGVITTGCFNVHIGGVPAARMGDFHTCALTTPVGPIQIPHVGGLIVFGAFNVLVGFLPQARMGDAAICIGPPNMIAKGAPNVIVGMASGGGGAGGGGGSGLAAMLGGIGSVVMSLISPTYPRAVLLPDGSVGTEYRPGIFIGGDAEYQRRTVAALDRIAGTPSGAAMFADLAATGRNVTIVPTVNAGDGNSMATSADGLRNADGTPGDGADTTVYWNPDRETIGPNPWQTRPPEIGLAHEMVHATHAANGEFATGTTVPNDAKPDPANPGSTATTTEEEARTTGFPPYDNEPYSENSIREEWDPQQPTRPYY